MSNVISKEVSCPKCNHTGSAHLYISINATNDPQFRDDLLSGKLLDYTCPNCGYTGRYEAPLYGIPDPRDRPLSAGGSLP